MTSPFKVPAPIEHRSGYAMHPTRSLSHPNTYTVQHQPHQHLLHPCGAASVLHYGTAAAAAAAAKPLLICQQDQLVHHQHQPIIADCQVNENNHRKAAIMRRMAAQADLGPVTSTDEADSWPRSSCQHNQLTSTSLTSLRHQQQQQQQQALLQDHDVPYLSNSMAKSLLHHSATRKSGQSADIDDALQDIDEHDLIHLLPDMDATSNTESVQFSLDEEAAVFGDVMGGIRSLDDMDKDGYSVQSAQASDSGLILSEMAYGHPTSYVSMRDACERQRPSCDYQLDYQVDSGKDSDCCSSDGNYSDAKNSDDSDSGRSRHNSSDLSKLDMSNVSPDSGILSITESPASQSAHSPDALLHNLHHHHHPTTFSPQQHNDHSVNSPARADQSDSDESEESTSDSDESGTEIPTSKVPDKPKPIIVQQLPVVQSSKSMPGDTGVRKLVPNPTKISPLPNKCDTVKDATLAKALSAQKDKNEKRVRKFSPIKPVQPIAMRPVVDVQENALLHYDLLGNPAYVSKTQRTSNAKRRVRSRKIRDILQSLEESKVEPEKLIVSQTAVSQSGAAACVLRGAVSTTQNVQTVQHSSVSLPAVRTNCDTIQSAHVPATSLTSPNVVNILHSPNRPATIISNMAAAGLSANVCVMADGTVRAPMCAVSPGSICQNFGLFGQDIRTFAPRLIQSPPKIVTQGLMRSSAPSVGAIRAILAPSAQASMPFFSFPPSLVMPSFPLSVMTSPPLKVITSPQTTLFTASSSPQESPSPTKRSPPQQKLMVSPPKVALTSPPKPQRCLTSPPKPLTSPTQKTARSPPKKPASSPKAPPTPRPSNNAISKQTNRSLIKQNQLTTPLKPVIAKDVTSTSPASLSDPVKKLTLTNSSETMPRRPTFSERMSAMNAPAVTSSVDKSSRAIVTSSSLASSLANVEQSFVTSRGLNAMTSPRMVSSAKCSSRSTSKLSIPPPTSLRAKPTDLPRTTMEKLISVDKMVDHMTSFNSDVTVCSVTSSTIMSSIGLASRNSSVIVASADSVTSQGKNVITSLAPPSPSSAHISSTSSPLSMTSSLDDKRRASSHVTSSDFLVDCPSSPSLTSSPGPYMTSPVSSPDLVTSSRVESAEADSVTEPNELYNLPECTDKAAALFDSECTDNSPGPYDILTPNESASVTSSAAQDHSAACHVNVTNSCVLPSTSLQTLALVLEDVVLSPRNSPQVSPRHNSPQAPPRNSPLVPPRNAPHLPPRNSPPVLLTGNTAPAPPRNSPLVPLADCPLVPARGSPRPVTSCRTRSSRMESILSPLTVVTDEYAGEPTRKNNLSPTKSMKETISPRSVNSSPVATLRQLVEPVNIDSADCDLKTPNGGRSRALVRRKQRGRPPKKSSRSKSGAGAVPAAPPTERAASPHDTRNPGASENDTSPSLPVEASLSSAPLESGALVDHANTTRTAVRTLSEAASSDGKKRHKKPYVHVMMRTTKRRKRRKNPSPGEESKITAIKCGRIIKAGVETKRLKNGKSVTLNNDTATQELVKKKRAVKVARVVQRGLCSAAFLLASRHESVRSIMCPNAADNGGDNGDGGDGGGGVVTAPSYNGLNKNLSLRHREVHYAPQPPKRVFRSAEHPEEVTVPKVALPPPILKVKTNEKYRLKLKPFKTKHKNIVDPVFLVDLDDLTDNIDRLMIDENAARPIFRRDDALVPAVFRCNIRLRRRRRESEAVERRQRRERRKLRAELFKADDDADDCNLSNCSSDTPVSPSDTTKKRSKFADTRKCRKPSAPEAVPEPDVDNSFKLQKRLPLKKRHKLFTDLNAADVAVLTSSSSDVSPVKRKLGRPRKRLDTLKQLEVVRAVFEESSPDKDVAAVELSTEKRKRKVGRPRKYSPYITMDDVRKRRASNKLKEQQQDTKQFSEAKAVSDSQDPNQEDRNSANNDKKKDSSVKANEVVAKGAENTKATHHPHRKLTRKEAESSSDDSRDPPKTTEPKKASTPVVDSDKHTEDSDRSLDSPEKTRSTEPAYRAQRDASAADSAQRRTCRDTDLQRERADGGMAAGTSLVYHSEDTSDTIIAQTTDEASDCAEPKNAEAVAKTGPKNAPSPTQSAPVISSDDEPLTMRFGFAAKTKDGCSKCKDLQSNDLGKRRRKRKLSSPSPELLPKKKSRPEPKSNAKTPKSKLKPLPSESKKTKTKATAASNKMKKSVVKRKRSSARGAVKKRGHESCEATVDVDAAAHAEIDDELDPKRGKSSPYREYHPLPNMARKKRRLNLEPVLTGNQQKPPENTLESASIRAAKSKNNKKTKKRYQKSGLFSDTFKRSAGVDDVQTDHEDRADTALLPPPIHVGRYLRERRVDFLLPYDIWCQYDKHMLHRTQWLPTPKYKKLRNNVHFDVKPTAADDLHSCSCTVPQDPNGKSCGEDCLNRLIYTECTASSCPCWEQCSNKRLQRHEWASGLKLVKTENRGYGVKCSQPIAAGQFICEYLGEVVSVQEFKRRMSEDYSEERNHYCLHLDSGTVIDGYKMGSICRFVNHSCQPNCEMQKWNVNGMYRVALFATRDITTNHELTYDYNFQNYNLDSQQACQCGSVMCRGIIGGRYQRLTNSAAAIAHQADLQGAGASGTKTNGAKHKHKRKKSKKKIKQLKTELPSCRGSRSHQTMRCLSLREITFIQKTNVLLLRNLEKIRKHQQHQTMTSQQDQGDADVKQISQKDVFMSQLMALTTSRSVKTRRLTLAENNEDMARTAELARILQELYNKIANYRDENGIIFSTPLMSLPSKKRLPDYFVMIKEPICLSTIEDKIQTGQYGNPEAFDYDVNLLFTNVLQYCGEDSELGGYVRTLSRIYNEAKADQAGLLDAYTDDALTSANEDIRSSDDHGAAPPAANAAPPMQQHSIDPNEEDIIQCICGIYRDEGLMVQCEKCFLWQHCDCMNVHGDEADYVCVECAPRPVDKEIPLHRGVPSEHDTPEQTHYMTLLRDDLLVRVDDTVYITHMDSPDSVDAPPIRTPYKTSKTTRDKLDILRVERLYKNDEGQRFAVGHLYLRPHETFHEPTRKFFHNELFRVPLYEVVPLSAVVARCYVMDLATYCKGRPIGAADDDVYICEFRVDKTAHMFNKIAKTKYTFNTRPYCFKWFEQRLQPKRSYSPHVVPERYRRKFCQADACSIADSELSLDVIKPRKRRSATADSDEDVPLAIYRVAKRQEKTENVNKILLRLLSQQPRKQWLDLSYLLTENCGKRARKKPNLDNFQV